MSAPLTLMQLAAAWKSAKADEQAANARRLEIEEQIVAAFPPTPEGTETQEVDGFEVKVTYGVARKVDSAALQGAWAGLSEYAQKAFRWSADVSMREMRALMGMRPDDYQVVSAFIETKPKKPSVTVTEL